MEKKRVSFRDTPPGSRFSFTLPGYGDLGSPLVKKNERGEEKERRGKKKKIRKNKREGSVHPSKSSKLKILTMSKVPEVAVERKSSAGHNVSLSRRMLLPMDDLDSLTLPL